MSTRRRIPSLICAVALVSTSVSGCDDPPAQVAAPGVNSDHKPGHDKGNSGGKGDAGGSDPRVAWEAKVNRFTATDLAVAEANGILYVSDGGQPDWLKAFQSVDGQLLWKQKVDSYFSTHPSTILSSDESTLYYGDGEVLYAREALTGNLMWSLAPGASFRAAALSPDESTLYLGGIDGDLWAVDLSSRTVANLGNPESRATGIERVTTTGSWVYLTGVTDPGAAGGQGALDYDGYVAGINLLDGSQSWSNVVVVDETAGTAPAYDGSRLFFIAGDGKTWAVDATNGQVIWSQQIDDPNTARGAQLSAETVIGPNGSVIVTSYDDCVTFGTGCVYSLSAIDGSVNWAVDVGGVWNSTPLVSDDGTVYVGSRTGTVYAMNVADGTPRWTHATRGQVAVPLSSAGAAGNLLFVMNDPGQLLALRGDTGVDDGLVDTSVALANTPWPKGSHDLRNSGHQ